MRVVLALALLATSASADPPETHADRRARVATAAPAMAAPDADRDTAPAAAVDAGTARHAIYVELGGRGGLWGVGYDWQLHPRIAIGAAASYTSFDGDRITTFAPYATLYPLGTRRHRGFVQLGPTVERQVTPSPVAGWDGYTRTHVGAEAAAGYEYRHGILVRGYAMVRRGDHLTPWLGLSLGWTL